jgi:hypothetical protein
MIFYWEVVGSGKILVLKDRERGKGPPVRDRFSRFTVLLW